jgi:hypothetical protein
MIFDLGIQVHRELPGHGHQRDFLGFAGRPVTFVDLPQDRVVAHRHDRALEECFPGPFSAAPGAALAPRLPAVAVQGGQPHEGPDLVA